jgi:hypothetical protein
MKWQEHKTRGFAYRCTICATYKSWRDRSIWELFNMPLDKLLRLTFNFSMQYTQSDILEIEGISQQTVTTFDQHMRLVTSADLDRNNIKFGGLGQIVEVDESLYIKVKHGKGKDLGRKQVWVFGLYDRTTQHVLFVVVPNRNATTLLNVIKKHVKPG